MGWVEGAESAQRVLPADGHARLVAHVDGAARGLALVRTVGALEDAVARLRRVDGWRSGRDRGGRLRGWGGGCGSLTL